MRGEPRHPVSRRCPGRRRRSAKHWAAMPHCGRAAAGGSRVRDRPRHAAARRRARLSRACAAVSRQASAARGCAAFLRHGVAAAFDCATWPRAGGCASSANSTASGARAARHRAFPRTTARRAARGERGRRGAAGRVGAVARCPMMAGAGGGRCSPAAPRAMQRDQHRGRPRMQQHGEAARPAATSPPRPSGGIEAQPAHIRLARHVLMAEQAPRHAARDARGARRSAAP